MYNPFTHWYMYKSCTHVRRPIYMYIFLLSSDSSWFQADFRLISGDFRRFEDYSHIHVSVCMCSCDDVLMWFVRGIGIAMCRLLPATCRLWDRCLLSTAFSWRVETALLKTSSNQKVLISAAFSLFSAWCQPPVESSLKAGRNSTVTKAHGNYTHS